MTDEWRADLRLKLEDLVDKFVVVESIMKRFSKR